MSFIEQLDQWFFLGDEPTSPTLITIGIAILLSVWIVVPLGRFWRDKFFREKRQQFIDQFTSTEQSVARQRFRWNLERAFRKNQDVPNPNSLSSVLADIEWPIDWPPNVSVVEYAKNVVWPNESGQRFWSFCNMLFDPVLSIQDRNNVLEEPSYSNLLNGRLVAAKFWNDWAHIMLDGLLSPDDIKEQLNANRCDIRALAVVELALAKAVPWDQSYGKQGLFMLARQHTNIAGGSRFERVRRWSGGKLQKLADWVNVNGTR